MPSSGNASNAGSDKRGLGGRGLARRKRANEKKGSLRAITFTDDDGDEVPRYGFVKESSQESVDPDENKEKSTSKVTVGPSETEIKKALAILETETLPGTTMELNSILRMRTMATHPDRMSSHNLSWEASNAHTAVLLEARNTLKKALEQQVLEPMNGASSQ